MRYLCPRPRTLPVRNDVKGVYQITFLPTGKDHCQPVIFFHIVLSPSTDLQILLVWHCIYACKPGTPIEHLQLIIDQSELTNRECQPVNPQSCSTMAKLWIWKAGGLKTSNPRSPLCQWSPTFPALQTGEGREEMVPCERQACTQLHLCELPLTPMVLHVHAQVLAACANAIGCMHSPAACAAQFWMGRVPGVGDPCSMSSHPWSTSN